MIELVPVLNLDHVLTWIPARIAAKIGAGRGVQLTEAQAADPEYSALIFSREKANQAGLRCDQKWHESNGYA